MKTLFGTILLFASSALAAQTQPPPAPLMYGESITLAQAENAMSAALQEASRNHWYMAIAIVDTGGKLVLFKKIDNTQFGSIDIAIAKATTAANFKRPTKVFEDGIAAGGMALRMLAVPGITPLEGGELIISNGKIIGAIGVSGGKSTEDGQVARAGTAVIK